MRPFGLSTADQATSGQPVCSTAWLSFAEFYFNDGDMDVARRMYEKVLEFPPPENRVYGFAVYKQAWVHFNLEDFRSSLASFVATIEFAAENPDASDATNLANSARRELVMPYARVGRPSQALEFFERYARNREEAMTMLESLAEIYFDTGQWTDTIAVYQNLMAENSDSDQICYWQSRVTNAIISSSSKPEQVRELQRMIDVWEAFAQQDRSAEVQTQCKSVTAGLLVWLATAWHREAIGSDSQPGTNDQATMNLAAELYRLILEKFPDMEQLEFPDIDRRDWPTEYRVSYYYAELLWKMEDWTACGPAFDNVVELDLRVSTPRTPRSLRCSATTTYTSSSTPKMSALCVRATMREKTAAIVAEGEVVGSKRHRKMTRHATSPVSLRS